MHERCEVCSCSVVHYSESEGLWLCLSCHVGLAAESEIGALDESQITPYEPPERLYRPDSDGIDPMGDFAQGLVMTAYLRGYVDGMADLGAALKAAPPSLGQTLRSTQGLLAP